MNSCDMPVPGREKQQPEEKEEASLQKGTKYAHQVKVERQYTSQAGGANKLGSCFIS